MLQPPPPRLLSAFHQPFPAESVTKQITEQRNYPQQKYLGHKGILHRLFHAQNCSFSPFPHFPPLFHLIDSLLRIEFIKQGLPCLPMMSSPNLLRSHHLARRVLPTPRSVVLLHLPVSSLSASILPNPLAHILKHKKYV